MKLEGSPYTAPRPRESRPEFKPWAHGKPVHPPPVRLHVDKAVRVIVSSFDSHARGLVYTDPGDTRHGRQRQRLRENAIEYMYMPDCISTQPDERMSLLVCLDGRRKYTSGERKIRFLHLFVPEEIRGWGTSNPPFGRPQVGTGRKVKEVRSQEVSPCTMYMHRQRPSTIVPRR